MTFRIGIDMKNFLLALLSILAAAPCVPAAIVTFTGTSGVLFGPYTEAGLTFESLHEGGPEGPGHLHFDAPGMPAGHLAIHGECCATPYFITNDSVHPFVLLSLTIYPGSLATTVQSSSGQIVILPSVSSAGSPLAFVFPANFSGTFFTWDAGATFSTISAIDNIYFENVVPEPSTILLLGTALSAVFLRRKRQK